MTVASQTPPSVEAEFYLNYGSLCAFDALAPPDVDADVDPVWLMRFERLGQLVVEEDGEQRHVSVRVVHGAAPAGTMASRLSVRYGFLFVGSTEALLEEVDLDSPGEGLVVQVVPGDYGVTFTSDDSLQWTVYIEPWTEPEGIQELELELDIDQPVALEPAVDARVEWTSEKITVLVPGTPDHRPKLWVEFLVGDRSVGTTEASALWMKDGAWVYELWLIGPRVGCDDLNLALI